MAAGAPKEGLLSASVASTSAPGSLSTAAATTATSGGAMDPPPRRSLLTRSFGELTMNGVRHSALTLTSTALGGGVLSVSYVMRLAGPRAGPDSVPDAPLPLLQAGDGWPDGPRRARAQWSRREL
ncbi:unnamed protein product [Prorocentrum cordatum]|uniref:Uncharacterized protein n=1 Tax=Prorocentrum cordatum TaxID=2364126 RepID=A0ABN9W7H1_9DINO|nr:unnamed protein product [Polarella glacialis]